MEYSKEDLMEAKKQILGVGENMGTEESKKIWEENAQFWDNAMGDESNEFHREVSDIGVLPNFFMCVPFVVTGGMFIIYDMALVGIILSVNRNESIAKDWIKLKSKRNAAKNGGQL